MSAFDPKRTSIVPSSVLVFAGTMREFIKALGGLALCWPNQARAQKQKIPRVGYLFSFTEREGRHLWDACRQGVHDPGYVEGRNIVLEPRWAEGQHERLLRADEVIE